MVAVAQNKFVARALAIIGEHGNSWTNRFVPVFEGMEDGIHFATGERGSADCEEWTCAYGVIARENVIRGVDACKPWCEAVSVCSELRAGALFNEQGELINLRYREVNIGCLNRIRDPKCVPQSRSRAWRV